MAYTVLEAFPVKNFVPFALLALESAMNAGSSYPAMSGKGAFMAEK
jgi:hypothetical protein